MSRVLPRGEACLACRDRKVRCDGTRPVCGPCSASSPTKCVYEGGSEQHALQQQISAMEGRLHVLQANNDGVQLQNPYGGRGGSQAPQTFQDIPSDVRRRLLRSFIAHANEFGFFLDGSRFQSNDEREQPSSALSSAIYLMGSYLSYHQELSSLQHNLLAQALHDVAQGLSDNHPSKVLHTVQAMVLIAQYLFLNGRLLEGKYQINAAVSIVLGAGFHKIRSGQQRQPTLPPPRDPTEEVERVNALWTVMILNQCWTAADSAGPNTSYDIPESRIDAPWPLDFGGNGHGHSQFPAELVSNSTIQNFLAGQPDGVRSLNSLHAKAAILFEQAFLLRQQRTASHAQDSAQFQASFTNLNTLISRFTTELPPVSGSRGTVRKLLVIHTLVHMSAIQLHYIFGTQNPDSHAIILSKAETIVALLKATDMSEFPFIDPIMGVLWAAVGNVFVEELTNIRARTGRSPPEELIGALETIISAMSFFAPQSPFMNNQLAQVRQLATN